MALGACADSDCEEGQRRVLVASQGQGSARLAFGLHGICCHFDSQALLTECHDLLRVCPLASY